MKKVAVIGSNSFSGSSFIDYILENTAAEVIGISRSAEYPPIFLPYLYRKERPKKFRFFQLDLNNDLGRIMELLDEFGPEVIVNYAAQGEVRRSWEWPEQWFMTNCVSTVKFSNLLKDREYLKRYVSVSTPEVYGESAGKNVPENSNFKPSTPYAASKLAGDLFLSALFKKYDFPVVFTRSSNVYGMHQQLYRIIPRTIIYLKLNKKVELHGEGKSIRSFVHVRDVADAMLKAIENGEKGEVYHIAPQDQEFKIRSIVKMICDIMNCDFKSSVNLVKENFGQDYAYSLNSSKIRGELGWDAKISIKEGIKETISWIEGNWSEIQSMPLEYIHKK